MDTIFMNSENSRTSEYRVLVLKLADKLDLRRGQKSVAFSILSFYYTWRSHFNDPILMIPKPLLNIQMICRCLQNH